MTAASVLTVTPISQLGAADPLDGTELVPLVQGGTTKQTTVNELNASVTVPEATVRGRPLASGAGSPLNLTQAQLTALITSLVNSQLANMAQATVKGRALTAGAGAPQDLTQTGLGDLVWNEFDGDFNRRLVNNVGYLRLLPTEIDGATFDLSDVDIGSYIYQIQASTSNITVPAEATDDLGDGFIVTVAGALAGSVVNLLADAGVTIVSLVDGSTGDVQINDFGVVTIWKVGTDLWHVNGTNFSMV
jgi:hypothetical protein